jgi:hypothetical protein
MGGPDASVRCVRCGEPLAGVTSDYCPRCGMPVSASLGGVGQLPQAPAAPESADSGSMPPTAAGGYEAPLFPSAPPPGAAYPQYSPAPQPQQPPTYPPYLPYGQPAAPSMPIYPPAGYPTGYPQFAPPSVPLSGQYRQPAGPSVPYYGQPAGPSVPYYGQPAGPSMPYYGPGMPAPWAVPLAPAQKSRTGLIVGLLVALLVVVAGGGTAAVLVLSHGGSPFGSPGTTATPPQTIVYSSSLTGSVADWPSGQGCSPQSDGFHITASIACYPHASDAGDARITVIAKQASGDTTSFYGIAFRRSGTGNNYVFRVDSNGDWSFGKGVSGTITPLQDSTPNAAIHTGLDTTNLLEVAAKGSHFDFLVNGVTVGSADDSTYSSGKFGLVGQDGAEAVFTDYRVTIPAAS